MHRFFRSLSSAEPEGDAAIQDCLSEPERVAPEHEMDMGIGVGVELPVCAEVSGDQHASLVIRGCSLNLTRFVNCVCVCV